MKFTITFKDPDGVSIAIKETVEESLVDWEDEDEKESLREIREEKLYKDVRKWVEYGEYLNVEIDTDAGTCVVLPVKK